MILKSQQYKTLLSSTDESGYTVNIQMGGKIIKSIGTWLADDHGNPILSDTGQYIILD